MPAIECDAAVRGSEHGLLFHSFCRTGILHARMMFGRSLSCQRAYKLAHCVLRIESLCQYDPGDGHGDVLVRPSEGVHEIYIHARHDRSFMKTERSPARMRLPEGFSHLRPDLGQILMDHRTGARGVVDPISQHKLACSVGISRVALSRIKNGHTWPQGSTLDRIMEQPELDWPQVAMVGDSRRPPLLSDGSLQGKRIYQLCQRLRAEREALGWSLAELSRRSGVSAAQLSRIERAQGGRSGVFTWHPDDLGKVPEDRRVVFGNPVPSDLAAGRIDDALDA